MRERKKRNPRKAAEEIPESFKFLSPEEIDERMKLRIDQSRRSHNDMWTEIDIALRDQVIFDLIGQGLSVRRIREELMARWGIGHKAAEKYYYEAVDRLHEDCENVKRCWRDILVNRLENIYEDASSNHDRGSMLKAVKQIAELTGSNAPKEVSVTGTDLTFNFTSGE